MATPYGLSILTSCVSPTTNRLNADCSSMSFRPENDVRYWMRGSSGAAGKNTTGSGLRSVRPHAATNSIAQQKNGTIRLNFDTGLTFHKVHQRGNRDRA